MNLPYRIWRMKCIKYMTSLCLVSFIFEEIIKHKRYSKIYSLSFREKAGKASYYIVLVYNDKRYLGGQF